MSRSELNRRTFLNGAAYAAGAVWLTSCGQPNPGSPPSSDAGGISVTDQRGVTVSFETAATSIVTIPMPLASLLIAVDQTAAHLTAMHNASWVAIDDGILGELFPDALAIEHQIAQDDFTPNVESVRALNPDVVVQWSDDALTAPLENAGLKVVGITNTGTQEDVDGWIAILASLLGKPQRAAELTARNNDERRLVEELAATRQGARPRILYFNRFDSDLKVAATGTYNDFYINLVGGTNPAAGEGGAPGTGMVAVDVEQVLTWDPEIVLLGNFDAAMPADIYDNPVWQSMTAVTSRRVYKVPLGGYRWDPPGQESPLMWHWLGDIVFPRTDASPLREKVMDYFRFLYAAEPSTEQLDRILWTSENGSSANYQQFNAP